MSVGSYPDFHAFPRVKAFEGFFSGLRAHSSFVRCILCMFF